MGSYLIRRLLLMIPTIVGILTITFVVIQFVPGGPLDQLRQQLEGGPGAGAEAGGAIQTRDGARRRGITQEDLDKLKQVYHLDRPLHERYLRTFVWFSRTDPDVPMHRALFEWDNWDGMLLFKFGDSFYRNANVIELIREKLPVSVSLGFWSFLITYPTCILLGIRKAVKAGERFDTVTSIVILIGYSIPGFVLAVLLIVLFGPGDAALFHFIPLSGLTSSSVPGYPDWSVWHKSIDYLHHIIAPILCLSIGSFAVLSILTKNAVLEEMRKQYVTTARAKGLSRRTVLLRHILRNSLIPLVTGFPGLFVSIFLTGSLLIEKIFNLDGLGLLSYEAVLQRDYPLVMGSLFIMTLIGLLLKLLTDVCYVIVDPRITFDSAQQ